MNETGVNLAFLKGETAGWQAEYRALPSGAQKSECRHMTPICLSLSAVNELYFPEKGAEGGQKGIKETGLVEAAQDDLIVWIGKMEKQPLQKAAIY